MNLNTFLFLQQNAGLILFKAGFLLVLFMVGIFLLVVLKQIRSMNTIVTQPDLFPYLESYVIFLELCTVALFLVGVVIL